MNNKLKSKVKAPTNKEGLYDWQVVLSVINPTTNKSDYGYGRPRRLSLHTLAAVVNRDAAVVLEEMRTSGLVVGYVCPDVKTPIFYLSSLAKMPNMIDTRNDAVWVAAAQKIKDFPPETVKGFKRFAAWGKKADGSRDYSNPVKDPVYAMDVPFEDDDKPYEAALHAALKAAGF